MNSYKLNTKKLIELFGKKETKDLKKILDESFTKQEKDLFYQKINMLRDKEEMNIQLGMPHELHYTIYKEGTLKEIGLIYNNYRYKMNPNLF